MSSHSGERADEAERMEPSEPETAGTGFERIFVEMTETPCPPQGQGDCDSSFELLTDGTVRIDPWGDPGTRLEGTVSAAIVREAAASFTSPELIALLRGGCSGQHASEHTTVRIGGQDHAAHTGHCNEDAIQSMREAMFHVRDEAHPGHSLISPPF